MTPETARAALTAAAFAIATSRALAADLGGLPPDMPYYPAPRTLPAPTVYIAVRGGLDGGGSTRFTSGSERITTKYDAGSMVSVAVGGHLDTLLGEAKGLRVEVDAGQMQRDARDHAAAGASVRGIGTHYVVGSLYYDLMPDARITPFIGAGAGLAEVRFDMPGATPPQKTSTTSVDWAYHATAGISVQLTPRWQVETAYRYFAVPSVTPHDAAGARQHTATNEHLLFAGLRAHF